jgi:hypothetical protein
MQRDLEPISATRIAALSMITALAAAVATAGLALSDPGDDAERISYIAALLVAAATATLLAALSYRRRSEVARLRAEAAAVVFELRSRAAALIRAPEMAPDRLAKDLREATRLTLTAREMLDAVTRAGVAQEAIELRVAIEAIEHALGAGQSGGG